MHVMHAKSWFLKIILKVRQCQIVLGALIPDGRGSYQDEAFALHDAASHICTDSLWSWARTTSSSNILPRVLEGGAGRTNNCYF